MVLENKDHAAEVLPLLQAHEIDETWAGIMPFTKDGRPIVGRLDDAPAPLYVATGMGGSGFCRGPAAGLLLASLIDDGISHAQLNECEADRASSPMAVLRETDPNRFSTVD